MAAVVVAVVAAGALALASRGGGSDPRAATRSDRSTTTGVPVTAAPRSSGPATTAAPARPSGGAPTTSRATAGTGATPPPPATALPGVVDHEDPRAVVQAVVDLATEGATPASAAQYLAGGRVGTATQLFVFLQDGGSTGEARGCVGTTTGARQATCAAHVVTAYGAPADVSFSLGRATATGRWTITTIRMPAGTPGGPG